MPAFILELAAQNPAPPGDAVETAWDTLQERLFLDDPIGAREAAWALIEDGVGCRVQAAGEVWPLRSVDRADVLGLPLDVHRSLLVGGFEVPLVWDGVRARLFAADCAEQVLGWFEAQHPLDTRLRTALSAIRKAAWGCIKRETLDDDEPQAADGETQREAAAVETAEAAERLQDVVQLAAEMAWETSDPFAKRGCHSRGGSERGCGVCGQRNSQNHRDG